MRHKIFNFTSSLHETFQGNFMAEVRQLAENPDLQNKALEEAKQQMLLLANTNAQAKALLEAQAMINTQVNTLHIR